MPPYAARRRGSRNIRGTAARPSGQVSPGQVRPPSGRTTCHHHRRCSARRGRCHHGRSEQPTVRRGAVLLDVLAEHRDQHGRDRHAPDRVTRAALGPAGLVDLAIVGPVAPGRRTDLAELQQPPSPLGQRALVQQEGQARGTGPAGSQHWSQPGGRPVIAADDEGRPGRRIPSPRISANPSGQPRWFLRISRSADRRGAGVGVYRISRSADRRPAGAGVYRISRSEDRRRAGAGIDCGDVGDGNARRDHGGDRSQAVAIQLRTK